MKFSISLLILFLFTSSAFSQKAKELNPKTQLTKIEKDIKSTTQDKETIALFGRKKQLSKQLKERQEELLNLDLKYQDLKKELALAKENITNDLRKKSPEYAAIYNELEQLEKEKKMAIAEVAAKKEKRKADATTKKEKRKADAATKKTKSKNN